MHRLHPSRSLLPVALALLVGACVSTSHDTPDPLTPRAERAETHRAAARVPGLSIAWLEDGRVAETAALGTADAETGRPVTDDTIFEAASLTKPVTAYLALLLAERGELDLDTPLSRHARPDPPVADDPRLAGVTARHVLSHGSGLPNWRPGRWSPEPKPLALGFDPGAGYAYSGEGFMWLQRVLEAITGLPLEVLVEREVLAPLGMTASSFAWRPEYETATARPHDIEGKPGDKRVPEEAGGASSLHTTAADYARFVAEVLRPTRLPPGAAAAMLRPQRAAPVTFGSSEDADPTGAHVAWGLGWGLERVGETTRTLWHWGDNGLFKAFVMASPETGDGFVVFTNSHNGLALAEALTDDALPGPHPAFSWLGTARYGSAAFELPLAVLTASDAATVTARLDDLAPRLPDAERERTVNRAGYELLWRERFDRALAVFRWNVDRYPDSANVWDSLAEAEMEAGDLEAARQHYEKSLELDPDSENARKKLAEIAELLR